MKWCLVRSLSLRLSVALSLCLSVAAAAQDDAAEEDSPYRPGLVAAYASGGGEEAIRVDETIAFAWEQAPPDQRLPPGPFGARWRGRLLAQAPGSYRFQVYGGGGRVAVTLAGKELIASAPDRPQWLASEPVELQFGYHPLEVSFAKKEERAQLALFWSGPNFVLEPVSERFLFHERDASPTRQFERGRRLAAALRCGACHADEAARQPLAAPALERLSGNIQPAWLVDWLSGPPQAGDDRRKGEAPAGPRLVRRMPHFGLAREEAADIAAWLLRLPAPQIAQEVEQKDAKNAKSAAAKEKGKAKAKGKYAPPQPSPEEGQRLFLTLGCLACHQHGELGESGLFGGGDLTSIAAKRPAPFFARWLADPASLNRDHRMPVFDLKPAERESLALWLASQHDTVGSAVPGAPDPAPTGGNAVRGEKLVMSLRCGSCHTLPSRDPPRPAAAIKELTSASDWSRSCAAVPDAKAARPGYQLAAADQTALRTYFSARLLGERRGAVSPQSLGRDLLVELNCLACHAREEIDRQTNALPARLQDKLRAVTDRHDDLGKLVPAMTPPALNSVGDKLTDAALTAAIRRQEKPHRPYLLVQMPKFNLTDEQLAALAGYFTATDRIPVTNPKSESRKPKFLVAGPRLVTTDGFGCTSCHAVGSVQPDKAPLNARGPDLSMLERRIRREWFDRWCYSPARIVPRMEMPSVQVPVRGVLGDNVSDQLAAVWHILNTPGFQPPEPNPVRVLRLSGVPERKERPIVLHDVIKAGDKTYLFPLVIGLPNRHNILFDLETNRLAAWWLGDTARQRTKGKSWFWEAGSRPFWAIEEQQSEVSLFVDGEELLPVASNQFVAELEAYGSGTPDSPGLLTQHRLTFQLPAGGSKEREVHVRVNQSFAAVKASTGAWFRTMWFDGVPADAEVRLRIVSPQSAVRATYDESRQSLHMAEGTRIRIQRPATAVLRPDGTSRFKVRPTEFHAMTDGRIPDESLAIRYETTLPVDQYLVDLPPSIPVEAASVTIAPGFAAKRLPLPPDIMPTGIDELWDGRLFVTSLKGQAYVAKDTNGDGLHDELSCLADGLATPYGIHALHTHAIVITKTALVEVSDKDEDGRGERVTALGWGWGVTDDYHDWAVGLPSIENGALYIGLPCQQDERSKAGARYRGSVLLLYPEYLKYGAGSYSLRVISSGHRFPMGLALKSRSELFVTDNQGNYNPFNELNFVRQGAHFGFINALEKNQDFKPPPLTKPSIDIPHPWTRSVNGICFLNTPEEMRRRGLMKSNETFFGPLEGHLVGCEYDTRALIRMTLQKVGDTYQGAAYPLSIPPENVEDGLLGPIVCAVSPRGDLYAGNIRDSGWGAGNNVGDIVQIKIEPDKLPCGIAEVRANQEGFTIDFFRPVDPAKARDPANYSLASYRRESTPAYGGPNLDRRTERIAAIDVSPDGKRVTLKLGELRKGFVYEFQLRALSPGKEPFFPAEAHYTLNDIP